MIDEKIRARFKLLRANKNTYEFLIGLLQEFTKDGSNEFYFHLDEGKRFFDLACGETNWKYWSDKDKRSLVRKPDIIRAIDLGNEDVARIIATDRVIEYIKQGKITITGSYKFLKWMKRTEIAFLRRGTTCRKYFNSYLNMSVKIRPAGSMNT